MRRAAALLALGLLVGCGYRWGPPAGPVELRIAPVDDRGAEPLFGARLARALAEEATAWGGLRLAGEDAALVLRTRVDEVTESGSAYAAGGLVEYRVAARVTATVARPSGEVLWRGALKEDREFAAGADVGSTERAKEEALGLLAADLARDLLRRVSFVAAEAGP